MTNTIGIVGSTQNTPQPAQPAPAASAAAPAASTTDFKTQTQAQNAQIVDPDPPISPRIVVDPLAGVITEFLNTSGQLQSQIPSAAVVAYLRAGLNAQGYAKPTAATPAPQNENAKPDGQSSGVLA